MNAEEGGKNKFQLKLVPKKFIKPAAWFPSVSPASISRRGQRRETNDFQTNFSDFLFAHH